MSRRRNSQAPHRFAIPPAWTSDFYQWQQGPGADVAITINNHGHHLIFVGPGVRADWWPSTSKLVFARKFKHACHERDHRRVMKAIERRLPRTRPQPVAAEQEPGWVGYVEALIAGAI